MVGLPHVLDERTVLREFDDCTGKSELGRAVFLCLLWGGGVGDGRVSVVLAAATKFARWSDESLTMEGSS